jgi:2,4-diketo-3-deoxy-L-fuconate hydrolase
VARERLDLHSDGSTLSVLDEWERNFPTLQRIAEAIWPGPTRRCCARAAPVEALALHAPVRSRNIICSGANYFKHVVDIVVAQVRPETEGMTSRSGASSASRR